MTEKPGDTTYASLGNTSIFSRLSSRTRLFSPGKIKITIQLLDDEESLQAEFKKSVTGQEILDYVCSYLDIVEKDYFGLRFQDTNNKFRYWVDCSKPLAKQFSTTSVVLRFRLRYYPENPFVLKEEITRYQLFVQLRRDLLHGRLHCSQNESATLAALILQSVLGDYDPLEHLPGYVSQYKLLLKQYDRLEEKICELHQGFTGMVPADAEAKFLEIASRLDTYGFDPYIVRDAKQNVEVIIGATSRGLLIYLKNVKVHYLTWKDLAKIDYYGKQLRIHPTEAYLTNYQTVRDHISLGESLLNTTFSDNEDEHPKKTKPKSNKKTQFKLACPSAEYAKNLWKHILALQAFFTADIAKDVKPKFSKPRIPLISRGSTFRCTSKRVLHEIEQDPTPPRDHQPANFTRYQIPKGAPRVDLNFGGDSSNKFGTMPAMHIKSPRPIVQPIEEEQTLRTPHPDATTTASNNQDSALASEFSNLSTNSSVLPSTSNHGVKTTKISIHLTKTDPTMDDAESLTETEKLFAQLRISTPIKADGLITPNGDIDLSEDQPIEALHNGKVKGLPKTTNGRVLNGNLPNGVTKKEGLENSRLPSSIGKQLASWAFGFLLIFALLVAICIVAFESNSAAITSLPYISEFGQRFYEPARTYMVRNYRMMVNKF